MKIWFERWISLGTLALWTLGALTVAGAGAADSETAKPKGAIFQNEDYFPIGVWLQHPRNAERFKAAGINLYVGLWQGPNAEQLAALKKAGMPVICHQNALALTNRDNAIIAGWMHGDEPDNAQSLGKGKGYGPPILPEKIQRDYAKIQAADPTRPVFLNFGQGVAWDNYIGRGVRRNHPEDYPEYIKGADIVSFDIYPVVHDHPDIQGKLEYVGRGVERLVEWSGGRKTVWNCIECTHISNPARKATPEQIRAQVWMALIHGSRGLIYFVHQFEPSFKEAALLDDAETLGAITRINAQIAKLARVLNQPTAEVKVEVTTGENGFPIASMVKEFEGSTYLFTVGMENKGGQASFKSPALPQSGTVEVLGESRRIPLVEGSFTDQFEPYAVHLYRINTGQL